MTAEAALIELLERLGANHGTAVIISSHELSEWPSTAVAVMKKQGLLTKTRPAKSAVCPGCERECVMPIHILSTGACNTEAVIVCDKRDDINRVSIPNEWLIQWKITHEAVAKFVAKSLFLRGCNIRHVNKRLLQIGMATGNKRTQMLCLYYEEGLALMAGSNQIPLVQIIEFDNGCYTLDHTVIRQLIDTAATEDPRYTPNTTRREARKLKTQNMYKQWQMEYRKLKKKRPNMSDVWCAKQITNMACAHGRDASTIKKHMK